MLALLLGPLPGVAPVSRAHAACDLTLPSAATTPALPRVAAAIAPGAGAVLPVLAVGSATVLGAHGAALGGFPGAMVEALGTQRPGLAIRLTVHGVRGQTAAAMLPVLREELATGPAGGGHFRLVLWQTGTVEAVRRVPPQDFAATLRQGMAMVHAAGADLVLVDPQFSPMLEARADLAPYRAAMEALLGTPGTAILDRYGLMRDWAQAGLLDLDTTPKPARAAAMQRVQVCLGDMLARRVLAGAAAAGR